MLDDLKKRKSIENYWLKRLAGDLPKTTLPLLNKKNGGEKGEKATVEIPLPAPVSRQLMEIGNNTDRALFILFFTGLNLAVAKYTGVEDLVIGTISPRQEGLKDKLLLCRNKVPGDLTLKENLNHIKKDVLADFNHASPVDYSFGIIYQKLLERSGRNTLELFNIASIYEKLQNKSKLLNQFDLVFALAHRENQLVLTVDYNTTLYPGGIIRRFCRNLVNFFDNLKELLDRKITGIDILCAEERQELMDFNKTDTRYPHDKTIHQFVEEQAEKNPGHLAADFKGKRLTYGQLNENANRLAHLLREKGVSAGIVVGIMMERSLDMIVGILAILKAGGAYLPIDPSMPKNRVIAMLTDSQAACLLTETGVLENHSYSALQGLREKKAIPHSTPGRKQLADLDTLPIPNRSMVNYEKYNRSIGQVMVKNIISLQTARGCPFDCAYCSKIWPRKHVFRSADDIFKEMKLYYDMGFRRFSIFDDIFNVNAANGMRLFEMIIKNHLEVQLFFPNGLRGDLLTKEYIDLLVEAGLASTALALETASPRLQKMINKHLNLDTFRENVEYFCQEHPHVILELFTMHGFPTETEEEARMTMDFIKQQRWLHFPYVFILKIYPDTDMADLAVAQGILREDILKCEDLAFHELSPTSPFEKSFTRNYQAEFVNDYFLSKERLLHVLPFQAKVLTEDEIVQKYDSYLPFDIKRFEDILALAGISREEVNIEGFRKEDEFTVPNLNEKLQVHFPVHRPAKDAMRVLVLDLTQYFTHDTDMLYDVVEPPLGAMYIMTYLKEQLGEKINGKIAKSRIDFDRYEELKTLLETFRPDVIGVRSLTFYRDFFHKTIGMLRLWGFDGPVIAGGPYATRNTETLLQDRNIDLLVTSEGEATFLEIIEKILENGRQLPDESVLKEITGIAFVPRSCPGGRELLLMDCLGEALSKQSAANPAPVNVSTDPAYIIYTSGSTGTPKGVITGHRNVVNVLDWFGRTYELQGDTRVIQLTNTTFDPSVEQIFSTLLSGATLYMGGKELVGDPGAFVRFVEKNQIHIINFVPGTLRELLGESRPLESLRAVISGGEKLDNFVKNQLLEKGYRLYNQYGPTETTIDALMEKCSAASVTLGRPISNVQCYLFLQNSGTLAPIGVKGELYIGGAGVSRGYLNNPELTNHKFETPNDKQILNKRFLGGPGGRFFKKAPLAAGGKIYRTGDLARWLPNGKIEFLGRLDHQVKIRGHRIELGEIEYQLQKHPRIKKTVVKILKRNAEPSTINTAADNSLCAYIVSDNHWATFEPDLREYLALELPGYMVPDYFVTLEKMPLTPGGKIDRSALPEPWDTDDGINIEYVSPTNEIEKVLAGIWENVLGRDKIGINENFFTIGGDSVKSIRIISRMKKAGYKVQMGDIFRYWSIARLAPRVKKVASIADQSVVTGIIPLTPVQTDFFLRHKTHPFHFNQAVMIDSREGFEEAALRYALEKVQAHHDALRMTYREENGTIIQTNHGLDYPVQLLVFDFRTLPGNQTLARVIEDKANEIQASIDLERGPLMKPVLFKAEDGDRLLLVIHHLVIDVVSWGIIFEDLERLYRFRLSHPDREDIDLPPKTDSFKRWSEQLVRYANSRALLKEKVYWEQVESADVPPVEKDFEGIPLMRERESRSFTLDEEDTRHLLTDANEPFGTEMNDLLLTALTLAIKETFGNERILAALEGHGREEIIKNVDITRTVGWFTSVYPVLLETSHTDLARQVIEIKDNLHRVPNKGTGYGILKYLTDDRNKEDIKFRQNPRISFNYLGQFDGDPGQRSFETAGESPGDAVSLEAEQEYEMEVTGIITQKCLTMTIAFNRTQFKIQTIKRFLDNYNTTIKDIIIFCKGRRHKESTPSDMDYKELSVEQLNTIFD
jgi:amino acid adenylation domain-containing protein/non-ribosomal peptide synthase protein (TIGR01720 family)